MIPGTRAWRVSSVLVAFLLLAPALVFLDWGYLEESPSFGPGVSEEFELSRPGLFSWHTDIRGWEERRGEASLWFLTNEFDDGTELSDVRIVARVSCGEPPSTKERVLTVKDVHHYGETWLCSLDSPGPVDVELTIQECDPRIVAGRLDVRGSHDGDVLFGHSLGISVGRVLFPVFATALLVWLAVILPSWRTRHAKLEQA